MVSREFVRLIMIESGQVLTRSEMMSRIRDRNTGPEIKIRHILRSNGFNYRLHCSGIPGRPDIVLRRWNTLILVNGCFWYCHDCQGTRRPKSNRSFWNAKIKRNIERDAANLAVCRELGWRVLVVWECALRGKGRWKEDRLGREMSAWIQRDAKRVTVRQIRGKQEKP